MLSTSLFTTLFGLFALSVTVLASVEVPSRLGDEHRMIKRRHKHHHHHRKHHGSSAKKSSSKKSSAKKSSSKKASSKKSSVKPSSSKGSSGKAFSSQKAVALAAVATTSAKSTSSSSSSGATSGGEITYYYQTGEVNCAAYNGGKVSDSQYITAVSEYNYYSNSLCGEKIEICYNSKCIDVTIVDSCQGCAKNHFDLSPAAFTALAGSLDAGDITSGITYTLP